MSRSLSRRIRRLEDAGKPPPVRLPNILHVDLLRNETLDEARAKFAERYGPIPRGHRFLVVPKPIETPEEDELCQQRFFEQQTRLRADVKRRPSHVQDEAPLSSPFRPAVTRPKKQTLAMRSAVAEPQA
jgi:hypothetical protein